MGILSCLPNCAPLMPMGGIPFQNKNHCIRNRARVVKNIFNTMRISYEKMQFDNKCARLNE